VRAVVQRVRSARVTVDGAEVGAIDAGLLVYVGVADGDGPADSEYTASKILGLRVFADDAGRMNRSVVETNGSVLVVSEFTLLGDVRRGRRPAFDAAADPGVARALYDELVAWIGKQVPVARGEFRASMLVEAVNDGPVTILIDSRRAF
jgi:D-tyrosyl-tRNA(Tyr) deacylase